MEKTVYAQALAFKKKFPKTVAWRIKQHAKVVEQHINPGEELLYTFVGQKNEKAKDFFNTNVISITNKRILIGTKRVFSGYFCSAITPDLYNDLKIAKGLIWGSIVIDTVKEVVTISNIDPKALIEIETIITEFMMYSKQKYAK